MATTTNFGWETPDDTDLVKDGAAAIRTVANSIDTSFVDLKGGTTGQVLSKASNTDLDFTWVTDAGDISGVTAGTGITGGGTSGNVTITNDMATTIDAKGDLVVGTGADAYARLAVGGTNGHVLQVDSTAATGMKWAAAPSASYTYTTATPTATQNVSLTVANSFTFYTEIGDYVHAYTRFEITSSGTANNQIGFGITAFPNPNADYYNYDIPVGVAFFFDNSAGTRYRCLVLETGNNEYRLLYNANNVDARLGATSSGFTDAVANGDKIMASFWYRKA